MHIGIASDHSGFALKQLLQGQLEALAYHCKDYGAFRLEPTDDYPDFVFPLAEAVAQGLVERGIAICGSGVGACIAANKVAGIRACLIHDYYSAHQGVEHDDMNLLCIGGEAIGNALARDLILAFLNAKYTKEARHQRRLDKIRAYEGQHLARRPVYEQEPAY